MSTRLNPFWANQYRRHEMKRLLFTAGIVLILAMLFLGVLFSGGYGTTTLAVGPQEPVGPQGSVGPGAVEAGPEVTQAGPDVNSREGGADTKVFFGFDWVILVACGLVLAALGFGVAVGLGTRKQLLQQ
jgi:amino acid transporter